MTEFSALFVVFVRNIIWLLHNFFAIEYHHRLSYMCHFIWSLRQSHKGCTYYYSHSLHDGTTDQLPNIPAQTSNLNSLLWWPPATPFSSEIRDLKKRAESSCFQVSPPTDSHTFPISLCESYSCKAHTFFIMGFFKWQCYAGKSSHWNQRFVLQQAPWLNQG